MAYLLRVFCASRRRPPLVDVLDWTEQRGHTLWLDSIPEVDPAAPGWQEAAVRYDAEKSPFLLQAMYAGERVLVDELRTFVRLVGQAKFGLGKYKVLRHLQRTEFLVIANLPRYDLDDRGSEAATAALEYFVRACNGIVQVEGEGFYKGESMLLNLG